MGTEERPASAFQLLAAIIFRRHKTTYSDAPSATTLACLNPCIMALHQSQTRLYKNNVNYVSCNRKKFNHRKPQNLLKIEKSPINMGDFFI